MQPGPIEPSAIESSASFHRVRALPILLGVIVDLTVSCVGWFAYFVVLGVIVDSATGAESELTPLMQSPAGRIGSLAIGTAATTIGGYVAAKRAGRNPIGHGLGVGVVGPVLAVVAMMLGGAETAEPGWVRAAALLLAPPAGAAGGYLGSVRRRAASSAAAAPSAPHVFEIDPRRFRKDRFYTAALCIFWILWLPVTLAATYLLFNGGPVLFLGVWLVFGWAGVLLIPLALVQRNRRQTLMVIADRLFVSGTGLFAGSKVQLHRDELRALTLEHYDSGDTESTYTLNLLQKPGVRPARLLLAAFVHPEGKAILLQEISAFLRGHGFAVDVRNQRSPASAPVPST